MNQQAPVIIANSILERVDIILTVFLICIVAIFYLLYKNRELRVMMQSLNPDRCTTKAPVSS